MDALPFLMFCCFYVFILFFEHILITAAYTLTPSQSIADGQTLVSQGGAFKLGFFSPGNSNNRYLGIWYATIPVQTVVWVANRDSPLLDTSGVLKIDNSGNILIVNQTKGAVWSSNVFKPPKNPILEFLQTGNLVLRDKDSNNYLWQSFDYPGDTMLPNMKLGFNLKTGTNKYLSAWRDSNDPSYGGFTYVMDPAEYLELGIRNGSRTFFRTGPWNGLRFSGTPFLQPPAGMTNIVLNNSEEAYYMYQVENQSTLARLVLTQTSTEGHLQRFSWDETANNWVNLVYIPRDRCDFAYLCGPYSTCDLRNVAVCQCLKGFKPKALQDWSGSNWSQGCVRETSLNCTKGDGFIKYTHVRVPDTKNASINTSINLDECRARCLMQCSCMAFSNSDIRGGGSGCIMWFTDLVDIGQLDIAGQDLYVRMAASELGSQDKSRKKERVTVTVAITSVTSVIVLCLGIWCIWMKKGRKGSSERDDLELPQYDLLTITNATNNFSERNKLGEGGFGPVYKGKLSGEQEIAVKKLSKDSGQGVDEFRNEVKLISKLQHRNLVRLVGCCIEGAEKMLVYEYMKNKSLDAFIFDETECRQLDWQRRFEIILGIARGLLYLHHDSRLRIIHRDLKASNILLDSEMVPKISDFGMARIFGGDQIEAKTKRVVGTYGYMSPEYAFNGHFSVKSDVFSFGVLVLEIISGKRNRGYYQSEDELNLLGHAWRLRNEGKSMELVDESLQKSCSVQDVSRCIHIGLLCVQKRAEERPTMSSVVLMLSSETAVLPKPQLPGFYMERSFPMSDNSSSSNNGFCVSNDATITLLHAR